MNGRWNLDVIYTGFDSPEFRNDMNALKESAAELAAYAGGLEGADASVALRRGVDLIEKVSELVGKLAGYASLVQSADAKDAQAPSYLGLIMSVYSSVAGPQAALEKFVSDIPEAELADIMAKDEKLADYAYLVGKIRLDSAHLLDSKCEEIMAKMSLSGGDAWSDLQGYLTSTVAVDYNGGVTNLSSIRNLAYDADPEVRRSAYEAELKAYDKIKDAVAFALNSIKLETLTDCELRGYASPLDRTLARSAMKRETLEAMLEAMVEYMPVFRKYLKAKAKALGHEGGLPFYDLFAPMGSSGKTYTAEEARDYLLAIFKRFDSELHDMVKTAFDEEWIDFYPRDGKRGGAFCAGVECIEQSRILTNFDGSFSDVVTLAHELGHAFHNLCIKDHRPLNHDYSMPVAETASTFNECIVMSTAIKDAVSKEEKIALLESRISDLTQIIVDIYSRFCFEAEVFEKRPTQFLPADALCQIMLDAQDKSYGDGLDKSFKHPFMWVCKSHYYGPTFYNFPYAFGGLFARGLYAQYEEEGEAFVAKYKKLLHGTPVASVEDAALIAGIDLTDKSFWQKALANAAEEIEELVALLEG